jgi:DNA-3-methyladenine glycosylase
MAERRGTDDVRRLCAGPGRLTQALGITGDLDGAPLDRAPLALEPPTQPVQVDVTPRVGISKAVELPWRYLLRDSPWWSRGPRPA